MPKRTHTNTHIYIRTHTRTHAHLVAVNVWHSLAVKSLDFIARLTIQRQIFDAVTISSNQKLFIVLIVVLIIVAVVFIVVRVLENVRLIKLAIYQHISKVSNLLQKLTFVFFSCASKVSFFLPTLLFFKCNQYKVAESVANKLWNTLLYHIQYEHVVEVYVQCSSMGYSYSAKRHLESEVILN